MSLDDVLTVSEVCKLWGRSRSAVRYHLDRGVFKSRWAGGVCLVDRASVVAVWGEPLLPLSAEDWPFGGFQRPVDPVRR